MQAQEEKKSANPAATKNTTKIEQKIETCEAVEEKKVEVNEINDQVKEEIVIDTS